jgi:hypothetical protein
MAFFSWFFYDNTIYEVIRDFTYLLKPILGLVLGYQLCRSANMKVIKTIIYVGFIIAVIHLGILFFTVVVHKVLNIHELRKYAGYFSDFEVYSLILVIFHKRFDVVLSKQRFYLLLITIAFSSFLYLSRANFIQAIVFYMALKGYFTLNKRAIIVLISFFSFVIIGFTIIYNMNLSRNGKGLEALLYKIKNAPKKYKNSPKKHKNGPKKGPKKIKTEFFCVFGIIFVLFGGFMYYLRSFLYFF